MRFLAITVVTLSCICVPHELQAQIAAISWYARFSHFKGDVNCPYGSLDCNQCANNVRDQFNRLKNSNYSDFEYTMELRSGYKPSGIQPREFLSRGPKNGTHLQSFTRLAIDESEGNHAWFAGTYGAGKTGVGAIYLIRAQNSSIGEAVTSMGQMRYIYAPDGAHPGGAQGLGRFLLVSHDEGDEQGHLRIYDFSNPGAGSSVRVSTFSNSRASAVGGTKLAGGGILIAVKHAGPNRLYHLHYTNSINTPEISLEFISGVESTTTAENVSLITECETGDIYFISITGDEDAIYRNNYWSLHRLQITANGPQLESIDSAITPQTSNCDTRAAGSAFVSKGGRLALYCAQKLGTDLRPEAVDCLLPFDSDGCGKFWNCLGDWAQELFLPGTDCLNVIKLDGHMTMRQYW